ncbi:hypothetical protein PFICI_11286 [Pestalotiopsis fici W106-1]|uniref:Sphingoid long-chain base transporter RSB1 n=1 Tax=Pestalotiopsis fici (strain W106-1 / CGMCC3.15140) TaxID=1229662 RepID=W3WWB8_PESFW|nr:uncharacterized protein PFICI_11286 [Pestalotiopsis fici W106-1]ETS77412.1 hypothetical protein PFICI_11286 [Pestalotiopsis fici W106-1]
MSTFAKCTSVTPLCPVEATTYGYYPDLGGNVALCVVFGLVLIAQLIIGFSSRILGYSIVIACGSLLECVGYIGRLKMHHNPWDMSGFQMQIVCLIIGPSFTAAGVYLTLKHFVYHNGPEYSRIKPAQYPWIFVCCDAGSIILQAAGGGVAGAAGKKNPDLLNTGNNIMIAGIAFQVATMTICGLLSIDYVIRLLRHRNHRHDEPNTQKYNKMNKRAHLFHIVVGFAYVTILIRSIYRIPEMAGGWGNEMMRNEKEFLLLDGLMIALASIALTLFHPAFFYPIIKGEKVVMEEHIQL